MILMTHTSMLIPEFLYSNTVISCEDIHAYAAYTLQNAYDDLILVSSLIKGNKEIYKRNNIVSIIGIACPKAKIRVMLKQDFLVNICKTMIENIKFISI